MKTNYGSKGGIGIIALLLTAFCSITFSGCGGDDDISFDKIFTSPEEHKGENETVDGLIHYRIEGVKGKSVLVALENRGSTLFCEFFKKDLPDLQSLNEGNFVSISGNVDILAGYTLLRNCEIEVHYYKGKGD